MHRRLHTKHLTKAVFLTLAFALLAAAWLVAAHGRRESALEHEDLPYYSNADLQPRWDWLSRQRAVDNFVMIDQHGHSFDRSALDEGPTVVSFFFSACVTVCPISTDMLMGAHRRMKAKGRAVRFLSISVTPRFDDAAAMRTYAKTIGLPVDWRLATGEEQEVVDFVRSNFFSDIDRVGADGLPEHLTRAFLVDREHRVRGVYDSASPVDIIRLQHDIARL
jgi:protein SCO1